MTKRIDFMLTELRILENIISEAGKSNDIPPTFYEAVETGIVNILRQLYSLREENIIAASALFARAGNKKEEQSPPAESEKINDSVSILNDRHNTSNSLHQIIEKQLFKDIRKGIGLNDGFKFLRELFDGDSEKMNKTLNDLNKLESFEAAVSYMNSTLNRDAGDAAVVDFMNILEKHYA